jgi:class 3 adenylate cyclase/ribosomal protein L40E
VAGVCASCGTENPSRAKFCMSCGAELAPTCPACGAENPPGAKFCIECGTELSAAAAPTVAPTEPPAPEVLPEERRKATVLFADLSGYTAVAERLDPEAVKSLVDRALRRLGQEVFRYGGRVDKYIGDNVMAVFGAPVSHEDDPERAVRAGLAMQAAMEEINEQIVGPGVSFELRVGINSGEVLAGQVGDEYTVIGDPVNEAARLSELAKERASRVLASEAIVSAASREEGACWSLAETVTLRGRDAPTRLAEPRTPGSNRS